MRATCSSRCRRARRSPRRPDRARRPHLDGAGGTGDCGGTNTARRWSLRPHPAGGQTSLLRIGDKVPYVGTSASGRKGISRE